MVKNTSGGDTKIKVNKGTFSSDVSAYLANDSIIVKHNDDYKVYSANDTVSVGEETKALAGLSSAARSKLDAAGTANTIKDKDGNSVTVDSSTQLVMSAISEGSIPQESFAELKEQMEEAIGIDISNIKNNEVFEIMLSATNNGTVSQIRDLGDDVEMSISLYLSENVKNELTGKTIKVLRVDEVDGDVEIVSLDVIGLNGNVLTFNSGKFSPDDSSNDFIICAITSSSGGNTDSDTNTNTNTNTNTSTKSYDAKDKNKDGVVSCEEEMNSANWIWSTSKQACVYKVTNTSVK